MHIRRVGFVVFVLVLAGIAPPVSATQHQTYTPSGIVSERVYVEQGHRLDLTVYFSDAETYSFELVGPNESTLYTGRLVSDYFNDTGGVLRLYTDNPKPHILEPGPGLDALDIRPNLTQTQPLPAGTYELRIAASELSSSSFHDSVKIIIGEKPPTVYASERFASPRIGVIRDDGAGERRIPLRLPNATTAVVSIDDGAVRAKVSDTSGDGEVGVRIDTDYLENDTDDPPLVVTPGDTLQYLSKQRVGERDAHDVTITMPDGTVVIEGSIVMSENRGTSTQTPTRTASSASPAPTSPRDQRTPATGPGFNSVVTVAAFGFSLYLLSRRSI